MESPLYGGFLYLPLPLWGPQNAGFDMVCRPEPEIRRHPALVRTFCLTSPAVNETMGGGEG